MKTLALLTLVATAIAAAQPVSLPPKSSFVGDGSAQNTRSLNVPPMFQEEGGPREKKSALQAIAYSLLLPGMGELYAGGYNSGKYFTIGEGALWVGFTGFTAYANWTQDDARNFATQHASAKPSGDVDQFYINVGNFGSADEYNQEILRERNASRVYSVNAWKWDNDANRSHYRDLRVLSDETFNNARFVGAAIFANHVISAINAARIVIVHNRSVSESSLYDLHASVTNFAGVPDGISFSLTRNF